MEGTCCEALVVTQASGMVGADARGSVTGVTLAGRAWRRGARAAIVHTRGGVRIEGRVRQGWP